MSVGRLFRNSHTLMAITVVQHAFSGASPANQMAELGFGPLKLVDSMAVNMSGSERVSILPLLLWVG